jgi:hypothetical protein
MYSMILSGKYWYQDLMEFLISIGFIQSSIIRCLFYRRFSNGSVLFVLNYINYMLYFGTSDDTLLAFETKLPNDSIWRQKDKHIGIWRLASPSWLTMILFWIRPDTATPFWGNTLILLHFSRRHSIPLPCDFVPSADDGSDTEEQAKVLAEE